VTVIDSAPFASEGARRKRLGQYFTGSRVARLLAALSGASEARSIVDPMVGSGDMLLACIEEGGAAAELAGVDIDSAALELCDERLRAAGRSGHLHAGNAFEPTVLRRLPRTAWDLVITNPPYVRYQSTARAMDGDLALPDAGGIRAGLLDLLDELTALDQGDKQLFEGLVRSYSGLADLALPSWLLCAGLVAPGGTLSMLVPTTWLSREYALPVRYLLARCFDVVCVVEDADASWFEQALVRTTLVVTRRVPRRSSAFAEPRRGHPHIRLTAADGNPDSLVGSLYPDDADPERRLASLVRGWRNRESVPAGSPLDAHYVPSELASDALGQWARRQSWLDDDFDPGGERKLLATLAPRILRVAGDRREHRTLDQLGWRVGQGLRTGANDFFYVSAAGARGRNPVVRGSDAVGGLELEVPAGVVRPVLRRQAELPSGTAVREAGLAGRLLDLNGYALAEDLAASGTDAYAAMPEPLAAHVRAVAALEIRIAGAERRVPELSAVRTNVRVADARRPDNPPRFWYQLPPLAPRHVPSLLMARINNGHPRCYLNADAVAIDANFSTFWQTSEPAIDRFALLAALNSSWTAAALETEATVLGGGGLKVEAANLRRLTLPDVGPAGWSKLAELGREVTERPEDLASLAAEIDAVLVPQTDDLEAIHELAATRLAARSA
jgi:N-6 DNA Methylase